MLRKNRALHPASLRAAVTFAVGALLLGTMTVSGAHVSPVTSFEDHYECPPNQTQCNDSPLTDSNGNPATSAAYFLDPPVPAGWTIRRVATSLNTSALGSMRVLVASQMQGPPLDPLAFVKKAFGNFVAQVQAAFVPDSQGRIGNNSGIGIAFHAAIDPNTGFIDRNNLYLFTSINTTPNARTFPTGHAFMLFKRAQGTYYMAAPPVNTYLDFSNRLLHTYKVGMSGGRIQAWVDGLQIFDIVDSPGADTIPGGYSMPGPPIVSGAVGLRTSMTGALFDDLFIVASPAYEARSTVLNVYGKVGSQTVVSAAGTQMPLGTEQVARGGDSGWQYHDHDFTSGTNGPSLGGPAQAAFASISTSGQDGITTSSAQVTGITGFFSDPAMKTFVSISADVVKAVATAACAGTNSLVDVVNFTYDVLSYQNSQPDPAHPTEEPMIRQGNVTRFNVPPETNAFDPANSVGPLPTVGPVDPNSALASGIPVRITLHSRRVSTDPQRVEAAAIRITFLAQNTTVNNVSSPANVVADIAIGDAIAGKLCVSL